jgi:D-alanine-D-alanine ligase
VTRLRVAVVGGGASCEHEVSLASAHAVATALDPARYDVVGLTIDPHGTWLDGGGRPIGLTGAACVLRSCDVLLPAVHGPHGEDGTLAALADLAGLPCVGSPVRAGALAMDKWVTKLVAQAVGVAVAPGVVLSAGDAEAWAASSAWTGPVVVKPVAAGSSHGVHLVDTPAALGPALADALRVDDRVLVEDVVAGREVDVAVLRRDGGHLVTPALEIVTDGVFDLAEKYDGTARFVLPAPLGERGTKELEAAAVAVYDALGCRGVARVDFFVTDAGPVLNEVNTMPGLTPASQAPRMFAAMGVDYPALLDLMVDDALAAHR